MKTDDDKADEVRKLIVLVVLGRFAGELSRSRSGADSSPANWSFLGSSGLMLGDAGRDVGADAASTEVEAILSGVKLGW